MLFAAFFALFVLFLYGPMTVIYILSFQGPSGGMTFPMNGVSLHWFDALFAQQRVGDIAGSFQRSIGLAVVVAVRHRACCRWSPAWPSAGASAARPSSSTSAIASLIMPGLFVGLGIALIFRLLGLRRPTGTTSGLGAQLTWTLPFGLLIMFAVLGRFNRSYEEAATDLGATSWQRLREVTLPILLPGIIGVALFGFTLSYDEFAAHGADGGQQEHAAARDLGDDDQRHLAGAVCGRRGHHDRLVRRDRRGPHLDRRHPAPACRGAGARP